MGPYSSVQEIPRSFFSDGCGVNQNEIATTSSFLTATSAQNRANYLHTHDCFQLKIVEISEARKKLDDPLELKRNYATEIDERIKFANFLNINFSSEEANEQQDKIKQLKIALKKCTSFPKDRPNCRASRKYKRELE